MKKEIIQSLTNNFDDHSHTTENGIEFWFARDIQHLLGYSEWRNFYKVITKAKVTCEATDNAVSDHFRSEDTRLNSSHIPLSRMPSSA